MRMRMQENQAEWLDKEFPAGYLLIYTSPNGEVRFSKYNPKHLEILECVQESIDRTCDGKTTANWKDEDRPEEAWRG